ncbi:hypothetical protein PG993_004993 [Apiospora rasikravindrae]|uniref:Uncharacterized protein n=1 Tax=Apiospora rasikravindrae TaxID=990691 RepID=A0ABR1TED0_9PEZI
MTNRLTEIQAEAKPKDQAFIEKELAMAKHYIRVAQGKCAQWAPGDRTQHQKPPVNGGKPTQVITITVPNWEEMFKKIYPKVNGKVDKTQPFTQVTQEHQQQLRDVVTNFPGEPGSETNERLHVDVIEAMEHATNYLGSYADGCVAPPRIARRRSKQLTPSVAKKTVSRKHHRADFQRHLRQLLLSVQDVGSV